MKAKEFLRQKVAFLASVVEIAISALVLIAIFLTGFRVVGELSGLLQDPDASSAFNTCLLYTSWPTTRPFFWRMSPPARWIPSPAVW